jgi:hypothetical protein
MRPFAQAALNSHVLFGLQSSRRHSQNELCEHMRAQGFESKLPGLLINERNLDCELVVCVIRSLSFHAADRRPSQKDLLGPAVAMGNLPTVFCLFDAGQLTDGPDKESRIFGYIHPFKRASFSMLPVSHQSHTERFFRVFDA